MIMSAISDLISSFTSFCKLPDDVSVKKIRPGRISVEPPKSINEVQEIRKDVDDRVDKLLATVNGENRWFIRLYDKKSDE